MWFTYSNHTEKEHRKNRLKIPTRGRKIWSRNWKSKKVNNDAVDTSSKNLKVSRKRSTRSTSDTTQSLTTLNATCGSWCWRRLDAHQKTSVLVVLNWSRFDRVHWATSSIHADTFGGVWLLLDNRNRRPACRRRTCVDADLTLDEPEQIHRIKQEKEWSN